MGRTENQMENGQVLYWGVSGLGFSVPSFLRIQRLMLPLVNIDRAKRIGGGKRCPCFSKRRKDPMPIGARAVTSMDILLRLGLIRLCGMMWFEIISIIRAI